MGCPDAELSIVLTTDDDIRELNRAWRGKDRPTDVLSFSQVEVPRDAVDLARGRGRLAGTTPRGRLADPRSLGPRQVLGDVVISVETAQRQAPRYGHDVAAELERLLVHGVLHLLGHDHVHGGPQARRMKAEERRLRRALDAVSGGGAPRRAGRPIARPRVDSAGRRGHKARSKESTHARS